MSPFTWLQRLGVRRGDRVAYISPNDPEATDRAFTGGWFHSGDAAVVHPDGYVEIGVPDERWGEAPHAFPSFQRRRRARLRNTCYVATLR